MVFPAVMTATLLGGWRAGVISLAVSEALAAALFLGDDIAPRQAEAARIVSVVLSTVAAGAIIALAEHHRRLSRNLDGLRLDETARREAALRRQLGILDEGLGFMVMFRGPEHRFVYANRTYQRLIGSSDLIGRPLFEVRPQVTPRVVELMDEVLRTGRPLQEREIPAVIAPGVVRYFDYSIQYLPPSEREPAGVFVEGHEVTEAVRTRLALEEGETRLRMATQAGGVGVWEWRLDTNEMIYSPEAREICGFALDGPVTYEMVVEATHPEDYPRTSAQARRALDPAIRDASPYEYRIVRPSGEIRWVIATGRAVFELRDGVETAARYVGTMLDITERRLAVEAARGSEQRLSLALAAGRMAVWEIDAEGRFAPSPALNRMIGLDEAEPITLQAMAPNFPEGELERIMAEAEQARLKGEPYFDVEYRFRRVDGELRWFNTRSMQLSTAKGEPAGAIGVVMDITERKQAEERLQLLSREVDHRANNLMSVVQGTVALSRAEGAEELRETILGRVQALARAHQLLASTRWQGADLRRLVEEEMAAFTSGETPRVEISGQPLSLEPDAAQAIAMAVHELATNAVKHGALSRDRGQVRIAWAVRKGGLRMTWTERDGPPVVAPKRSGFGSKLLKRALGGRLNGAIAMDWRPDGLVCELSLPLNGEAAASPPSLSPSPAAAAMLASTWTPA